MQLVEKHIIKKSNKLYAELDQMCFLKICTIMLYIEFVNITLRQRNI